MSHSTAATIFAIPAVQDLIATRNHLIATSDDSFESEMAIVDTFARLKDEFCSGSGDLAYEVLGQTFGESCRIFPEVQAMSTEEVFIECDRIIREARQRLESRRLEIAAMAKAALDKYPLL